MFLIFIYRTKKMICGSIQVKAKTFLTLLVLFLGMGLVSGQITESKITTVGKHSHPNILIIMTDEQSATMLSCTENKWLHTPALDNLAKRGIRFERAYATNPLCVPSRISIQIGMFASKIGVRDMVNPINEENQAILESLYPRSLGQVFRGQAMKPFLVVRFICLCNIQMQLEYDVITTDEREKLARDASHFLLTRKTIKPFLLFVSFINPHDICYDAIRYGWPSSSLAKNTPPDLFEAMKMPEGVSKKEFFDDYCPPLPSNHQPMFGESYTIDSVIS